ncbi:hypothetical protein VM1G_07694 [Cytospora mali]|uniref:Uncharacterized protein n=1 Tax=Cytospora mali TaxID=578113 RepID=A0A194W6B8_CYTMA|nr:hypothetical protein VM1G_07694 [Valsa mali]
MDIHELLKMASNAISNIASVPTVSSVVTAQHHVQQHISALQSGWGYQTALNSVQLYQVGRRKAIVTKEVACGQDWDL